MKCFLIIFCILIDRYINAIPCHQWSSDYQRGFLWQLRWKRFRNLPPTLECKLLTEEFFSRQRIWIISKSRLEGIGRNWIQEEYDAKRQRDFGQNWTLWPVFMSLNFSVNFFLNMFYFGNRIAIYMDSSSRENHVYSLEIS